MKMRTYWENERRKLLGQPLIQDTDNQENTAIDAPLGAVLAQGGWQDQQKPNQNEIDRNEPHKDDPTQQDLLAPKSWKVIFNAEGNVIKKIETPNQIGQAYIAYIGNTFAFGMLPSVEEIPIEMPRIIGGFEHPRYQIHDYRIAIEVYLINQRINAVRAERDSLASATPSETALSKTYYIHSRNDHTFRKLSNLPAPLDPTIIKAVLLQESGSHVNPEPGSEISAIIGDPMTANFPGDWMTTSTYKMRLGFRKGKPNTIGGRNSIWAAIQMICMKGNIAISYTQSNGYLAYYLDWTLGENGNWWEAVEEYHGSNSPRYRQDVIDRFNKGIAPKPENY